MAVNKRKILESAQKHLQKGALDKALDDYLTLLKADPKDSNIRLKVGDLHLKLGRNQDAIDGYLRVAQQFMSEGFDAKAVALYKQVSKLDDKRYEVHAQLGDLYQRMGLASEALKALQFAADGAYRAGDKAQALELLRKMAALDPSNTTNRLKVADLLRTEGRTDDALAEYDEVVRELERQGSVEQQIKVLERALELSPERLQTLRALARANLETGAHAKALAPARKLSAGAPEDLEAAELLGRALEGAGNDDEAADVFRALAEKFRARGDEDRARALVQRYGSAEKTFSADDSEPPVLESDGSGELELDPELDATLGLEELEPPAEPALTFVSEEVSPAPAAPEPELDPDADVEQLLAEASVFARYGKHDRAIETLRAALRVEPGSPLALEKLGEALLAVGNRAHAVSALQRAGAAFVSAGDASGVARVRGLLGPLDAKAAAALPAAEALTAIDAALPDAALPDAGGFDAEIDIEIDPGLEPSSAELAEVAVRQPADDFSGIEIEALDVSADGELSRDEPAGIAQPQPASLEDSSAFSFDAAPKASARVSTGADETVAPAATVEADFEEGEFYREQGLVDEARALYERVLAAVPNHPRAQLRIGELLAPLALAPVVTEPTPPAAHAASFDLDLDFEVEPAAPAAPTPPPEPDDTAPQLTSLEPPAAPAAASTPPLREADETVPALSPETFGGADFDLAAELTGAFADAGEARRDGTDQEGFHEVFAAFKAGVKQQVGDGDSEAHYDLGIAYREMGLLEDALGEFRMALSDPARELACLHLMGVCALDLGRAQDAIAHLSQALAGGSLPAQQEAALRLDLGRSYQAAGDVPRARASFEAARAADPGFDGLDRLLAELDQAAAEACPAGASAEGLESFDDLLAEEPAGASAVEEPATPTAQEYESFGDFLADDSQDAPAESPSAAAEAASALAIAEPLREPEPPAAAHSPVESSPPEPEARPSPAPAPARRKKKISFV